MPSAYFGCQIGGEIEDALRVYRGTLEDIRKSTDESLADLRIAIAQLSGTKAAAQATIGDAPDDQILWQAVEKGPEGNQISITYRYLGPLVVAGSLVPRPAGSEVVGNFIYLDIPVAADGTITSTTTAALTVWVSGPDVSDLVTGTLVGTGLDTITIQPQTFLSDGLGAPLTDAEDAADAVSRPFGHKTYQDFLKATDIPIIESDADAAQYLRDQNDQFVIINGKLLFVEGTNLVGINALWELLGEDLDELKKILAILEVGSNLPHYLASQNVTTTTIEIICGEEETFETVTEVFREINVPMSVVADRWTSGSIAAVINYIFWSKTVVSNRATRERLKNFGIPEDYFSDILVGETPDALENSLVQPPTVFTVEEPTLFTRLGLTDAEIKLLLAENVDGVLIPGEVPFEDRLEAIKDLCDNDRSILDNGFRSSVKKCVAVAQSVDIVETMADSDLTKELATRGKACARQEKNFDTNTPAFPDLDLPNLPTADLPSGAAQIEAAFGALSSVIDAASSLFDYQIKTIMGAVKGLLNAITNLGSLVDNLLKNDLLQCLLGTDGSGTGVPEVPGVGSGAPGGIGEGGTGGVGAPTFGGIPLPTSLLVDALKGLSTSLDETITDAFEFLMNLIRQPLCQIQNLISSMLGFSLDGLENPCKDEKELDDSCPPEETQEIINDSDELSSSLEGIDHLVNEVTETTIQAVEETVEEFTGDVKKNITQVTQSIDRGVKTLMEDIQKSVDSKLGFLDQLDQAIRGLTGELRETKISSDENSSSTLQCSPPSLGLFTDAISDFL